MNAAVRMNQVSFCLNSRNLQMPVGYPGIFHRKPTDITVVAETAKIHSITGGKLFIICEFKQLFEAHLCFSKGRSVDRKFATGDADLWFGKRSDHCGFLIKNSKCEQTFSNYKPNPTQS